MAAEPTARADTYQAAIISLPTDPHDHRPASYLAAINHLRLQQDLAPLELAVEQSDSVADLLPYYLAARGRGDTRDAEQIALGLMAGWQISGIIRDASVLSFDGHYSWTVDRALGAALLSPGYRAMVFDPDDHALALGAVDDQERGARAFMLLTYQFFAERSYEREQTALLDELDRQRAAHGLEPVMRLEGPQARAMLAESAARVQEGSVEPRDELYNLLQDFVDSTSHDFQGLVISTMVLDGWRPEFPRDLVQADQAGVAIVVTHRKTPDSAWGEHVVMMMYAL